MIASKAQMAIAAIEVVREMALMIGSVVQGATTKRPIPK